MQLMIEDTWRGAVETAQQLRALAVLPEDLSSAPSTAIWLLTTACNFSCRGLDTLFWCLRVQHPYAQTQT